MDLYERNPTYISVTPTVNMNYIHFLIISGKRLQQVKWFLSYQSYCLNGAQHHFPEAPHHSVFNFH